MPDRGSGPPRRERRVAALRYESGSDEAPRVVAAGRGLVAERILAEALAGLDLGVQVPEDLYRAVAEALAWAYRLDSSRPTEP
jgi:flagellar biosynthesis protein